MRDAAAMINAAKRPVLYLGGGAINAADEIRQFAEKANLPTTMTLMALGMLPKAHPLSLGMLGMHGARSTNYILQEADLLIVMGARFDDRAIGKTEQFCPNAKIIHVDIDRAELGKIKQPHVAIGRRGRGAGAADPADGGNRPRRLAPAGGRSATRVPGRYPNRGRPAEPLWSYQRCCRLRG